MDFEDFEDDFKDFDATSSKKSSTFFGVASISILALIVFGAYFYLKKGNEDLAFEDEKEN